MPSFAGGGAERVMISLANAFVADGLDTQICVADDSGPRKTEVDPRVSIHVLGKERLLLALPTLIRYLRTSKPTVLYVSMIHANIIASLAVLLSRCRCRLVLREAVSIHMLRNELSSMAHFVWIQLAKFTYRRADCVVSVSMAIDEELKQTLGLEPDGSRSKVIYNAIDRHHGDFAKQTMSVTPPWIGDVGYVVGIGRLTAQKGFDTLVKSVAEANKSLSNTIGIIILGDGEERSDIESAIQQHGIEHFFLPGFVENPLPFLSSASAYVLSSRFEGMPNAMLQALACGTPIIATDCPTGPREILENGKWGKLVPVDDVSEMATAIVATVSTSTSLCSGEQQQATMGDRVNFGHLSRFDFDSMVNQYKECGRL